MVKKPPARAWFGAPRGGLLARYARYRRGVRTGQLVMLVAGAVAVVHLFAHIGAFGTQPTGWQDLLVGYPAAVLLFLGGAYLAGRVAPR